VSQSCPTRRPATNIAQQYRFFAAENRAKQSAAARAAAASRAGAQAPSAGAGAAAAGGAGGSGGGGDDGNGKGPPPGGWTVEARLDRAQLPQQKHGGELFFEPPKRYFPSTPMWKGIRNGRRGYVDDMDNVWDKGPSRTTGEPFEWDVQLSALGKIRLGHLSRDGKHVNVSMLGIVTH